MVDMLFALILVALVGWIVNTRLPVGAPARNIVNIVLTLVVVGVLLWIINVYVPMAASIKAILNVVVVAATCVWVLKMFDLWDGLVRFGHSVTHRIAHSGHAPESSARR